MAKFTIRHKYDSVRYRLYQWDTPGKRHSLYLPKHVVAPHATQFEIIKSFQHLAEPVAEIELLKSQNDTLQQQVVDLQSKLNAIARVAGPVK